MRAFIFALAVAIASTLAACPPSAADKPAAEQGAPCTKVGQSCAIAPGKLGTCVVNDACTEAPPACFVCQSQH